jgi:hypothetical protein
MLKFNNIANDGNLKNELNEISKIVSETNQIGQNIIIKLSEQGDALEKTEEKLEHNEFILSKTFRILRGMSWFGWILNFFTKDISTQYNNKYNNLIKNNEEKSKRQEKNEAVAEASGTEASGTRLSVGSMSAAALEGRWKSVVSDCLCFGGVDVGASPSAVLARRWRLAESYGTGLKKITEDNKEEKLKVPQENLSKKTHSDTDIREILNNENKELLFIENELKNLHSMGLKIGECIDDHNERLERISNKTENISNKIIKNKDYISTIL